MCHFWICSYPDPTDLSIVARATKKLCDDTNIRRVWERDYVRGEAQAHTYPVGLACGSVRMRYVRVVYVCGPVSRVN